ncbi:hypothetical protein AIOL_002949 [Candidatus Rhodobacter oscarellae]|uniref:Uncharacterized protein n=1 Tax=Candidatus Rhodobacter oscarellae TaxID=1675527 RepID=A0A0J9E5M1_9RHOB|nr:hypothetical protein AIOL_002949 [Candidatus Rhodobacter lobularis]
MNLQAARHLLIRDRLDWNKPHLRWVADRLYRMHRAANAR